MLPSVTYSKDEGLAPCDDGVGSRSESTSSSEAVSIVSQARPVRVVFGAKLFAIPRARRRAQNTHWGTDSACRFADLTLDTQSSEFI